MDKGGAVGKVCSVDDPVATGQRSKHRKCDISATHACFRARPSLRVVGNQIKSRKLKMEPIEGVGGKRMAKTLHHICPFRVHSSTGELPTPKSTQYVQANFTHL